jgi:hypothetical protein
MKFVTSFSLSGNGTDFREFGYTGSSDDISGCWIAVTICISGARHNILTSEKLLTSLQNLCYMSWLVGWLVSWVGSYLAC